MNKKQKIFLLLQKKTHKTFCSEKQNKNYIEKICKKNVLQKSANNANEITSMVYNLYYNCLACQSKC